MKVFLLAGQSNMQGFGHIEGMPVIRDERVFNLATGQAEVAVEPLHQWAEHPFMPPGIGIGLAMPFALDVLKAFPKIQIGFIPSARGGSRLDEWLPGNPNFERAVSLFERAAKNVPGVELAGILWHQGCADAAKRETAETYRERFLLAMRGFRERFKSPRCPVVAGEIAKSVPYPDRDLLVEQTRAGVAELGDAAFVTSEGLTAEGLHFDSPSIRAFGPRYAAAYLEILKAQGASLK